MVQMIKLVGKKEGMYESVGEFFIDIEKINAIQKFNKVGGNGFVGYVSVVGFNLVWYLDKENYNKLLDKLNMRDDLIK